MTVCRGVSFRSGEWQSKCRGAVVGFVLGTQTSVSKGFARLQIYLSHSSIVTR